MNAPCPSQISGLFQVPVAFPPLLDVLPPAVAVLSPDRRVVYVNRAFEALTGFVHQAAVGIGCAHIMRSSLCAQQRPAAHMQELAGPACREGDIINRDRQKVPIRLMLASIRDGTVSLVGFLETMEDVRPPLELDGSVCKAYSSGQLVGRNPQMEKIFRILPMIAQSDSSVLVTEEAGSGGQCPGDCRHPLRSGTNGAGRALAGRPVVPAQRGAAAFAAAARARLQPADCRGIPGVEKQHLPPLRERGYNSWRKRPRRPRRRFRHVPPRLGSQRNVGGRWSVR